MLKHRLLFGSIMTAVFVGLILLDGYLDGSEDFGAVCTLRPFGRPPQATIFMILIALLAAPAQSDDHFERKIS